MSFFAEPWFYWSVVVAVGLPTALLALTEVQLALERRGNFLARPVGLLRTFILPMGALLLILTHFWDYWSTLL